MTPVTKLIACFENTLKDGRFSRGEKQAIQQLLADGDLSERQLANLRSRLFNLAKAHASGAKARKSIGWLETALKTIPSSQPVSTTAKVFFSPGDKCLKAIKGLLGLARQKVDICVFTITDNRLSEAIIRAHRRGVRIRIISDNDKAHDTGSDVRQLIQAGIPLRTDKTPDHMHHKFALIDGNTALTGSYNWTRSAAADNFENLVVTDDPKVVKPFQREFDRLWRTL